MRHRAWNDVLISMGAIGLVLVVLIAFDSRLREQVAERVDRAQPTNLVDTGHQMREMVRFAFQVVKAECQQHTTMVVFVTAATVLTLFMVRV
jgi:hypothetical protein